VNSAVKLEREGWCVVTVCLPYKNVARSVCRRTHRRHTNGGTANLRGNAGQRFLGNLVPLFLWQRFSDVIHRHITAAGLRYRYPRMQGINNRGIIFNHFLV
jgi:hypothetical protein